MVLTCSPPLEKSSSERGLLGSLLFGGPVVSSVISMSGAAPWVAVGGVRWEGGGGVERVLAVPADVGRSFPAGFVCMVTALDTGL